LAKLHPDNFIIYNSIEGAGRNGIWKKTLSARTNLHENTITKGMKELISKKLVKEFKTSKNPTKRMYVLFHLEPSEDSTGGNFYREGELDEGLVNTLNTFIVAQVESKSWIEQPHSPTDKGKKRSRSSHGQSAPDTTTGFFKTMKSPRGHLLVPYPPSFTAYPTAGDVLSMIEEGEFIKDLTLTLDDVRQLILQLVYDNKLEEISEGRYRSVRRVWSEQFKQPDGGSNPAPGPVDVDEDGYGPGNGLSYVPCGRCPVAKECRVGGTISPERCVYMKDWLESW
jgi:DNA-directed RNA polymerase III subunit RPC6